MSRYRLPLTSVLPDARDRHRSAPVLPTPPPPAAPETSPYRLPDGRIVLVYEDVARGAASVTFQLLGGTVVNAEKVKPHVPPPAPAWCQALAKSLVTTVIEWAEDGATKDQLIAAVADLLEEELLDQRLIERLANVYTVDTDQAALIALVRDAQQDVERVR
jgi:hypothetical protein